MSNPPRDIGKTLRTVTEANGRLADERRQLVAMVRELVADHDAQDPHAGGLSAAVIKRARALLARVDGGES